MNTKKMKKYIKNI